MQRYIPSKNYVLAGESTPAYFRPSSQAQLVPGRASNPSLAEADAFMPDEAVQSGNGVTSNGLGKRGFKVNRAAMKASFTQQPFTSFLSTQRLEAFRPPNRIDNNGLAPTALPAAQAQQLNTSSQNISAAPPAQLTAPTSEVLHSPTAPADVAGMGDFDPRTSFLERGTTIRRGRYLYSTDIEGKPMNGIGAWGGVRGVSRLISPNRTTISGSRISAIPPAAAMPAQRTWWQSPVRLNRNRIHPVLSLKGLGEMDKPTLLIAAGAIVGLFILIKNRQPAR
jgi:hypothetical protein